MFLQNKFHLYDIQPDSHFGIPSQPCPTDDISRKHLIYTLLSNLFYGLPKLKNHHSHQNTSLLFRETPHLYDKGWRSTGYLRLSPGSQALTDRFQESHHPLRQTRKNVRQHSNWQHHRKRLYSHYQPLIRSSTYRKAGYPSLP